jgi:uncharacterized protein YjbI with pentapeptide repeats
VLAARISPFATRAGIWSSGLHVVDSRLTNVLFENCRLDYATLATVRSTGPVAFVNCTLVEASITGGKLDKASFDDCRMTNLELDHTDLRGADLRNNQLETITGITSLRGATLTPHQLTDLSTALIKDLSLRIESIR